MNKKALKIILIIILILNIVAPITAQAYSYTANAFKVHTDDITGAMNSNSMQTVYGVLGIVRLVGIFAAIGMLIWIGIKYIMSSAQEKANLKGVLWIYVLGAVIIFGASNIMAIIVSALQNMAN